jgi:hypothetical protein
MKLKKLLFAASIAGALVATTAFGDAVITLNPSAPNTGCTNLVAGACGAIDPAKGSFDTDNSHIGYTGFLDIAASTGATTFAEAGNFKVTDFTLLGALIPTNILTNFNIYAGYNGTGAGQWVSPANFVTTGIATLNVTLYASPVGSTGFALGNPTSGSAATPAAQGITFGTLDFILGTSSLIPDTSNFGTASKGAGNTASTTLTVLLNFTPATGTTGATGFFEAPVPFVITIGSQAGGNANNTTFAALGSGVRFSTINNNGGGSLSYTTVVPEPGSLALLGLAFAGMGFIGYRRRLDR